MGIGLSGCLLTLKPAAGATVLSYTGSAQTYTVPASVCGVEIDAKGAGGGLGGGAYALSPGSGGEVKTRAFVKAGDVLTVYVGGQGGNGGNVVADEPGGAGGTGGGGKGGDVTQPIKTTMGQSFSGGGGGGASYVYKNGGGLVVAGGGGGSAGDTLIGSGEGGDGGHLGGDGTAAFGGGGGVPGSGGTPGLPNGSPGTVSAGGAGGSAVGLTPPNFSASSPAAAVAAASVAAVAAASSASARVAAAAAARSLRVPRHPVHDLHRRRPNRQRSGEHHPTPLPLANAENARHPADCTPFLTTRGCSRVDPEGQRPRQGCVRASRTRAFADARFPWAIVTRPTRRRAVRVVTTFNFAPTMERSLPGAAGPARPFPGVQRSEAADRTPRIGKPLRGGKMRTATLAAGGCGAVASVARVAEGRVLLRALPRSVRRSTHVTTRATPAGDRGSGTRPGGAAEGFELEERPSVKGGCGDGVAVTIRAGRLASSGARRSARSEAG